MARQRQPLAVGLEQVEAAFGDAKVIYCSEPIHASDVGIFRRLLNSGVEFVLIRAGRDWLAFLSGKPPAGFPGRRLSRDAATRALLTQLQGREPSSVITSSGWAVLKRAGRLTGEWSPTITT
jgi:hypothetical protein